MGLRVVMGNSAPAILANHDRDRHASAMVWCLAAAATRRGRMALGERTRISGEPTLATRGSVAYNASSACLCLSVVVCSTVSRPPFRRGTWLLFIRRWFGSKFIAF
jgi:hypothetical protein